LIEKHSVSGFSDGIIALDVVTDFGICQALSISGGARSHVLLRKSIIVQAPLLVGYKTK
jgi:hypothetical protein